jgi:hypothetical protein
LTHAIVSEPPCPVGAVISSARLADISTFRSSNQELDACEIVLSELIAARHWLPSVYPSRQFVTTAA